MHFSDSLDGLLADAMQQARRRKVANKAIKKPEPPKIPFKPLFLTPEYWREGKVLAVIHRSSDGTLTLLGAFREYVHLKVEARKLSRIDGPCAIQGEQYVTGDHWLAPYATPQEFPDNPEGIEDREIIFDLELSALQITARQTKIVVRLEKGWTRSVKLRRQTQFVCVSSKTFIFLPPNLDILEAMSFENKIALKKRLESK